MLAYFVNYLIVQTAIVLFILPFYIWYKRKHISASGNKLTFNHHLEYFFSSKQANYLVFFWALGEALVWFVVPEFLLLLVVFMRIKNKKQLLVYDILGTIAGILLAFIIRFPQEFLLHVPYIKPKMIEQTYEWYEKLGIFGLIHQPFSGVPFKSFVVVAVDLKLFIVTFLLFAIIVRISRYLVAYAVFVSIYPVLHRYVYKNYIPLFVIATIIFSILLYRVYLSYA
jgi:membrane protein YqaA with SNARE-associated domain